MLKEKFFMVLVLCFGLFCFTGSEGLAQTTKGTFIGYAYLQPEGGNIEHATMVVAPDNLKQVLYLGIYSELNKELAECFKTALEYEFELEVSGNVKVYENGEKFLIVDNDTTCSHRN